jgi:hypothetical protein
MLTRHVATGQPELVCYNFIPAPNGVNNTAIYVNSRPGGFAFRAGFFSTRRTQPFERLGCPFFAIACSGFTPLPNLDRKFFNRSGQRNQLRYVPSGSSRQRVISVRTLKGQIKTGQRRSG